MTRARSLKTAIRARAAKTGERYTTARRHVLKARSAEGPRAPEPPAAEVPPPPASAAAITKGTVSDARSRERTGHGLDHWFAVLDRFGAKDKGHTASARHLHDDHGVDGWYSQGITVAYERARGIRALHQRCDGEYEVSATKVVAATPAAIAGLMADPRARAKWAQTVDAALVDALAKSLKATPSKGFVVRPDGLARYRYRWDDTTVEFRITPKEGGKASIAVQHMKLSTPEMVEQRRSEWKAALAALAAHLQKGA